MQNGSITHGSSCQYLSGENTCGWYKLLLCGDLDHPRMEMSIILNHLHGFDTKQHLVALIDEDLLYLHKLWCPERTFTEPYSASNLKSITF